MSHTPPPWEVEQDGDSLWVTGPDRSASVICDLVNREMGAPSEEDYANAVLIAAAPDLLAACEAVADWCSSDDGAELLESAPDYAKPDWTDRLYAAIAKAKGEG